MPDYRAEARSAAVRHTVPPAMFERQIGKESRDYDPRVIACEDVSPAGARGIGQFMPATAASFGIDPCDPLAALDAAAAYMSRLHRQYGSWRLALAAYNAGPGNVQKYGGVPPFPETQAYLTYILGPGQPEPTTELPLPDAKTTTIATDDANFRSGPGVSQPTLHAPLKAGSTVWLTDAPPVVAEGHTWRQVSLGLVGWIAAELLAGGDAPGDPPLPASSRFFNPDYPVSTQEHDWDCAQDSTWWALRALGRKPSNQWMEDMMLAGGVESTADGLTDATGAKLAAWINDQYEPEIHAYAIPDVSFAQMSHLAGLTAIVAGGHNWYDGKGHWVAVRRYGDGALELANPGGQFSAHYGEQRLDRAAWDAKAPWSAVVIERKA